MSLHPTIRNVISTCATPRDTMLKLKQLFNIAQTVGRNELYTEFFNLKMAEGTDLTTYFNRIDNLLKAVETSTMKFSNDLINWVTINSLPSHFDTLKEVIATSLTGISKDDVRQRIYKSRQNQRQATT